MPVGRQSFLYSLCVEGDIGLQPFLALWSLMVIDYLELLKCSYIS